jgi:hypothetical protein
MDEAHNAAEARNDCISQHVSQHEHVRLAVSPPAAPRSRVPGRPAAACPPRHRGVLEGDSSAGRAVVAAAGWLGPVRYRTRPARVGDLDVRAALRSIAAWNSPRSIGLLRSGRDTADILAIAVADGLGSSMHSTWEPCSGGTAAREVTLALDLHPDPDTIDAVGLLTTVAAEIVGVGRVRGLADRGLCCLLVVVVPTAADPDGSRSVWIAQVGDVSIWTHTRISQSVRLRLTHDYEPCSKHYAPCVVCGPSAGPRPGGPASHLAQPVLFERCPTS